MAEQLCYMIPFTEDKLRLLNTHSNTYPLTHTPHILLLHPLSRNVGCEGLLQCGENRKTILMTNAYLMPQFSVDTKSTCKFEQAIEYMCTK